ncbi:DUF6069 family protein [Jidongwangia harbinensis]|uniref:DUF6069 family protein n=1 Tax=Jidongwangia harbinensis TaxID=2878561 RepID=UPI001CD9BC8F|nr:DUF6069 family protein [Jidongwangia harbinensis]MCA2214990.1 DUF6069 family protein [Jidongwangia harbinensis]
MTNDTRTPCGTAARRTGRALTVAAATAGAVLLWAVHDLVAGAGPAVRSGATTERVGPVAVALTALVAGLTGWGLLALLERTVRRPGRVFRAVALVVLLLSLAGPLAGAGPQDRMALLGLHLTVGVALIAGLPCRSGTQITS